MRVVNRRCCRRAAAANNNNGFLTVLRRYESYIISWCWWTAPHKVGSISVTAVVIVDFCGRVQYPGVKSSQSKEPLQ